MSDKDPAEVPLVSEEQINQLRLMFSGSTRNEVELLLAASAVALEAALRLASSVGQMRERLDSAAAAELSHTHLADAIAHLQDAAAAALRTYNALLRSGESASPE